MTHLDPPCTCGRTDIGLDMWGYVVDHHTPGPRTGPLCPGSGELRAPAITDPGAGHPDLTVRVGDRVTVEHGDETSPRPFGGAAGTVLAISASGHKLRLGIRGHEPLTVSAINVRDRFNRRARSL